MKCKWYLSGTEELPSNEMGQERKVSIRKYTYCDAEIDTSSLSPRLRNVEQRADDCKGDWSQCALGGLKVQLADH